jgi:3D (Asp-Asp-Asp) domain-containing protein
MMTTRKTSRTATAEKIAALIRIYRAAVASGDSVLEKSTSVFLEQYGIQVSDLTIHSLKSERVDDHSSPQGGAA